MKKEILILALLLTVLPLTAQPQRLTLEDCREMALKADKDLQQARTRIEMAGYDRKIALANYFPTVSAKGAYLYNNRDIALVDEYQSSMLQSAGSIMQGVMEGAAASMEEQISGAMSQAMTGTMTQLMTAIQTNPALAQEYMSSPMWQTVLGMLQKMDPSSLIQLQLPDISEPVNAIGADIDKALHPDLHNIWMGAVTVQQPVFVGGKILYSNKMAALGKDLAQSKYDMEEAQVVLDVEQAYWQIISIAGKKRLSESYAELLHTLESDVNASVEAGVMTESDALQIQVKANEADMLRTKATNGLTLAKMLLCQRIGLPLDSDIELADEHLDMVPLPERTRDKSLDDIYADRPETRSLELASRIYDAKAKVIRADGLPKVALTANWLVSNPNPFNGIQNTWNGGMLSTGVMVNIPLFHGLENANKYRKAKAEASLYRTQLEDAKEKIELQVTRERKAYGEALEKLSMAQANLASAEENLRTATIGFEAGVISTSTVLSAQTAWLSAHSDCLDAGTELQMAAAALRKAEGMK
ncbi:MAG: TolC family protein [Oscillospiraceae bacterium]|nr:TolC family protein [Oscillospiraceae bacterium]